MRFSFFTDTHLESGPPIRDEPKLFYKFRQRDRARLLCLTSLVAVSLGLVFLISWSTQFPRWNFVSEEVPADFFLPPPLTTSAPAPAPTQAPTQAALHPLHPLASLNGPPTASLWGLCLLHVLTPFLIHHTIDNLRNDTKYISSWISAGWSKFAPILIAFTSQELTLYRSANDVMTYVSPSTLESIAAFIFVLSGKSSLLSSHH
jgi:hypothetical protein